MFLSLEDNKSAALKKNIRINTCCIRFSREIKLKKNKKENKSLINERVTMFNGKYEISVI